MAVEFSCKKRGKKAQLYSEKFKHGCIHGITSLWKVLFTPAAFSDVSVEALIRSWDPILCYILHKQHRQNNPCSRDLEQPPHVVQEDCGWIWHFHVDHWSWACTDVAGAGLRELCCADSLVLVMLLTNLPLTCQTQGVPAHHNHLDLFLTEIKTSSQVLPLTSVIITD